MTTIRNLQCRNGMYYVRMAVPKALRTLRAAAGLPNTKEVPRSLNTSDRALALRLLPEAQALILREFAADEASLLSKGVRALVAPTALDLEQARFEFLRNELMQDERERSQRASLGQVEQLRELLRRQVERNPPTDMLAVVSSDAYLKYAAASGAAEWSTEKRVILAAELKTHLAESEYVLVSDTINYLSHTHGWDLKPNTPAYNAFARELMKMWLLSLQTAAKRDQGDYSGEDVHSSGGPGNVISLPAAGRTTPGRKSPSLRDHMDTFIKERKAGIAPNARQDLIATLRQFIECNGERDPTTYRKSDMAKYKKGLLRYPANATKLYPGLKFDQVIEKARVDGKGPMSTNTMRSKLGSLSVFGQWLEDNVEGIEHGSFTTTLPKRTDRRFMEPFSRAEVVAILNSNAFTGAKSANNYKEPGTFRLRGWHYWLTMIAAFTGARVNEIAQMLVKDVREEKGFLVFDINAETEDKSLKTKGSKRIVPIHPQLVALGLLDFVKVARDSGHPSLFSEIPIDRQGRRAEQASRWFRRFLVKVGVKGVDDLGGAHRWRHTITDALRRADVDDFDIALVLGHTIDVAKMTGDYGREQGFALGKRVELLSKASYPGVDYSRLM